LAIERTLVLVSFHSPALVINDLELVKHILIRDFDHFTDNRTMDIGTSSEANKYASGMMTNLAGSKWKKIRSLMTPAFTSGKLKTMLPLIQKVVLILLQTCKISMIILTCISGG
jgi:cytochrome P450 family 6